MRVAGDIVGVSARLGGWVFEWPRGVEAEMEGLYRCLGSLSVV